MTLATSVPTYVTPPLRLGDVTVAFSEPLSGKNLVQRVTALLLTWLTLRDTHHLQLRALEAMGAKAQPEDWHEVASHQYDAYLASLMCSPDLMSHYLRLKREFFNEHQDARPLEMNLLVAALHQRAANVDTKTHLSH